MEGSLSQGGIVQGGVSFGGFDFPGQMRVQRQVQNPNTLNQHQTHHCQGSSMHSTVHDCFPLTVGTLQSCDQMIMGEFSQGDRCRNSASDEDEPSFTNDGGDNHHEAGRAKKGFPWQRVKWTDKMVKLMITAVSYIGEDATRDSAGGRRKFLIVQKKGKWKSVSKVMAERGYHVSPQQCEDKFNDLNKRYKRLNDIIGRGTSCQVVENPALLDLIDYLSEKEKDDVRKILNSKQLFYEEMCSYHNDNRLHLPHDPALQRSLQVILRNRDDHDNDDIIRPHHDDHHEDDQDMEADDHDDFEEKCASHRDSRGIFGESAGPMKKMKQGQAHEEAATFGNSSNCPEYNKSSYAHGHMVQSKVSQALTESTSAAWLQKQWVESCSLQLEEQKLQIQVETLELDKQKFKWQKFSKKKDRQLEKLKLQNERMKLENERLALELKQKGLGSGLN